MAGHRKERRRKAGEQRRCVRRELCHAEVCDETEKIGLFSIGDLKLSEEERSEVIAEVKSNMEQKLKKNKVQENAERMAILSVWEIYQPVVTKVDPTYTVITEFTGGTGA